jgi:hypothetical protein
MTRFADIALVHEGAVLATQVRQEIPIARMRYRRMTPGDRRGVNNDIGIMVTTHSCDILSDVYDDAVARATVHRQEWMLRARGQPTLLNS